MSRDLILMHMWAKDHRDLEIYKRGFELANKVFLASRSFPKEETYSLTDQIRRSSRSVCANICEAWGKRRYEAVFVNKLTDSCAELLETQTWLDFALACGYLDTKTIRDLDKAYIALGQSIMAVVDHAEEWCKPATTKSGQSRRRV